MSMLIAGPQLRAARAMARLDQGRLADLAGVSTMTVQRLETQPGRLRASTVTVDALRRVLEAAGVEFTDDGKPGVRMREFAA